MARRRYCGMCDAWVSGLTCRACGADTDAPRHEADSSRVVLEVAGTRYTVTVTRASRSPTDGERGWRVYGVGRKWIAHGVTAQDALDRAQAALLRAAKGVRGFL